MKISKTYSVLIILVLSVAIVVPTLLVIDFPDKPIIIRSDADFLVHASYGSGSENDPFIIENKEITKRKNPGGRAISIFNTSKHFIIRNCIISNYGRGIGLDKIGNVTAQITDNYIDDCKGIAIYFSNWYDYHNVTMKILRNTIIDANDFGIYLSHCNYSLIEDNQIFDSRIGFRIDNSFHTLFSNNTIGKCSTWGGILDKSDYTTIINNKFNNQSYAEYDYYTLMFGLDLSNSKYLEVSNNTFSNYAGRTMRIENIHFSNFTFNNISFSPGSGYGLLVEHSNTNFFWMNAFQQNAAMGLKLTNSSYNIIHHNAFLDNGNSIDKNAGEYDSCTDNVWFDSILFEGNFWLGWDTINPFVIAGQGSLDLYPLDFNPIVT